MNNIRMIGLAGALAVAATVANAGAQLVTNGEFTSVTPGPVGGLYNGLNTATGWVDNPNNGYNFVVAVADSGASITLRDQTDGGTSTWNGTAPTGNFAALDGDYGTGPLEQTITGLQNGAHYALTFDYAFSQQAGFDGDTIQTLTASIGPATWTSTPFDLPSHGFSGWMHETLDFTADGTSDTLSFLAAGNLPVPPFALVSEVSVIPAPEPGAWTLLILWIGALRGLARYRRPQDSKALSVA